MSGNRAPLLEIIGLSRRYALPGGRNLQALDNVSLSVAPGEILGIVGESGCGKSTLARIVMALDRPSDGNVLLEGDDLFALPPRELARRRRDFQMIFQDPYGSLDPRMSVARIVAEPLRLLSERLSRAETAKRVGAMLEDVGLKAEDGARFPHEFSGGQRQRIAIARALITKPKLVVADEATSALDLTVQAQILRLLKDLRARHGLTMLFISHNLGVIEEIADRVGVMQAGRLVEIGGTAEVMENPREDYTRRLLAAEPTLDFLRPATA